MTPSHDLSRFGALLVIGLTALLLVAAPLAARGEGSPNASPVPDATGTAERVSPIERLLRFVSRADGERCPMYPTCSHYARQAFAEKGPLLGWILTSDRLLRCGRDEIRLAPPINVEGVRHTYDPLSANIFWWDNR